jgi:hypothetical protein
MNFSTQYTTNKRIWREWLYADFPATHVATLNLEPLYQSDDAARTVCQRFRRKFNDEIWGCRKMKGKNPPRIGFLGVIQNDPVIAPCHLHLAFYGFPAAMSDEYLLERFKEAAQHTSGARTKWHGARSTDFERLRGRWIDYITRQFQGTNDCRLLAEYLDMP